MRKVEVTAQGSSLASIGTRAGTALTIAAWYMVGLLEEASEVNDSVRMSIAMGSIIQS